MGMPGSSFPVMTQPGLMPAPALNSYHSSTPLSAIYKPLQTEIDAFVAYVDHETLKRKPALEAVQQLVTL